MIGVGFKNLGRTPVPKLPSSPPPPPPQVLNIHETLLNTGNIYTHTCTVLMPF